MTGTVKFFIGSKGYGFITDDATGEDIFVHVTELNGQELQEGDKVEYVEEDGKKRKSGNTGPKAIIFTIILFCKSRLRPAFIV